METSIASSLSIGKEEVSNPIYESNMHFDWGLEGCAMEMEVDKEEGAMDVVVSEPKSQYEGDTSTFGSHVGPATNPTPTPTLYNYTKHFTTDKVFLSEKELVEWTRSAGKRYGFVIIIKASEKSGKYRKFVKKSLGEEVSVKKRAMRSTGTKKIECPFLLKGVKDNDGWTASVHNGTHNHPPAVYLEGHSYPERLSAEQTVTLVDLSVAMVKPKQILSQLKGNNPSNVTTIRHVYNARHKYRVIEKARRTQMQHLMARLQHFSYVNWDRSNKDRNVTDLF
ncbi:uncharacterized protein LOC131323700 [Rhododendron vialii]|uniref:uncharacterized protein LOC131323700 n=1 Tax=Rhododendron vialii TaxID=182163 RepID=UPI00265D7BA4|nr:uncharacterized protein LOC131323700 [Rhododendron vialii]